VLGAIPTSIPGITSIVRIVVDDGSSDETAAIAERCGAIVVRHPRNLGTGRAFMSGVREGLASGADLIVGMDADGQFSPRDIPMLVAPLLVGEADVSLCTRFGPRSALTGSMPWRKRVGNQILCGVISATVEQRLTDVSCGFRAFTREAALRVDVRSDFEYMHESLLTWHRAGLRIVEVELPVRAQRATGESRVVPSVTRYGLRVAPVLIRAIRDYSPLKFFGTLGLVAFVPSVLIGLAVLGHWLRTGETVPYTSFITVSVGGVLLGVLLGAVALLADLSARLKFQVDEMLHESRRRADVLDRPGSE
jgi:glycosyltransferase involved in cell wall biosynthesis